MKHILINLTLLGMLLCLACSEDEVTGGAEQAPPDNTVRVPQEEPTIQAAIDAAELGDTVLVADGTYGGEGNQDITFGGKTLVVMSENGPANTVIAIEADSASQHFAFELSRTSESGVTIDGFTITGAFNSQGSVLNLRSVSPRIKNCVFAFNGAVTSGGVVRCKNASPTFENCTFVGNSAPTGAVIYLIAGSSPHFSNCILAFSTGGEAVVCSDALCLPTFSCSDIYGNENGDWIDCIASFLDTDGNVAVDPMFCDVVSGNLHLDSGSPCTPENSGCGEVIGALGADCGQ